MEKATKSVPAVAATQKNAQTKPVAISKPAIKAPVANTQVKAATTTGATKSTVTKATTATKVVSNQKPAPGAVKQSVSQKEVKKDNEQKAQKTAVIAPLPAPQVVQPKLKVEEIHLTQLFKKIEFYRDNNRSLLIIDKLDQNDSFTFFKYQGKLVDLSAFSIKESLKAQTHEASVEFARKEVVHSLKSGSTLVFFLDKMLKDLPEFFKGAPFFSVEELFVPDKVKEESYFRKKLITEEEDVDAQGFGNKGGYYPDSKFAAVILSKTVDKTPEEIMQALNLPMSLFDVLIIS